MTTSTNMSVKKAASVTLAGVMAVGMVPAAAFAADAPEAQADDGISALTADEADVFAGASISQVQINGGAAQTTPSTVEVVKQSAATNIVPVQLTSIVDGRTLDLLNADGSFNTTDFEIVYGNADGSVYVDPEGGSDTSKAPTKVGSYTLTVKGAAAGNYKGMTSATLKFSVVGKSLQGAFLYEGDDISDTTFTYNGESQKLGVGIGGIKLAATDFSVQYYKADGATLVDDADPATAPTDAGSYVAVVTGTSTGDYEGSETQIKFTVAKLDLSKAAITVNDTVATPVAGATNEYSASPTTIASISGVTDKGLPLVSGDITMTYPKSPTAPGSYTVVLNPEEGNKNITGTTTLPFNVVNKLGIYVTYGGTDWQDEFKGTKNVINLSDDAPFSVSKLKVYAGDNSKDNLGDSDDATNPGTRLTDKQYTVTVTGKDGAAATVADLSKPGTWNVTVAINSDSVSYLYGGKETMEIKVINGIIDGSNIFVTYDGSTQRKFNETYNGNDFLPDISTKVIVNGKQLTQGTDYELAITDKAGNPVTEIVNAGTYNISVTSSTWDIDTTTTSNVCEFTVDPVTVGADQIGVANEISIKGSTGIAYTGKAITPSFTYTLTDDEGSIVVEDATLPADAYAITNIQYAPKADGTFKQVKEIVKAGVYQVTIADAADDDNYVIQTTEASGKPVPTTVTVNVIDAKPFADVAADAWYAEAINDAHHEGYMNGYGDTQLFGPNDNLTRAQAAIVFYNMAGGERATDLPGGIEGDDSTNWVSFSDVDPKADYAKQVYWAKEVGIVTGYANGSGKFGPKDEITREQFALMLYRYAKRVDSPTLSGVDVDKALASKPDGSKVDSWARDAVAWAVQSEIMGKNSNIMPLSHVTRAETAAMAVRFQPKSLVKQ